MRRLLLAALLALGFAVGAQAQAGYPYEDCGYAWEQIESWGGYLTYTSRFPFGSTTYIYFEAYFPTYGEYWQGSCFYDAR